MPRFRIPYNAEAVFVGPAHATGYHFIAPDGTLSNDDTDPNNYNLVSRINRVQSFSYTQQNNLFSNPVFGKIGSIKRYQSSPPNVTFSLEYLQMGVRNEDKLGFYVNYPDYSLSNSGNPIYPNNYEVFLLNGFYSNSDARMNNSLQWPMDYRDCRNVFLGISKNPDKDYNNKVFGEVVVNSDVIGFGNCYLTSYSCRAAVGDFPTASVSFVAENTVNYSGNSGQSIPSINPRTFTQNTGIKFSIPNNYEDSDVSVLLPGDIILSFSGYQSPRAPILSGITSYGPSQEVQNSCLNFSNLQAINYEINIDLPRANVFSLNHKTAINRKVQFPVYADLTVRAIVNDYKDGSINNSYINEQDFDVSIRLKNPVNAPIQSDGIRYDFKKAKLLGYNFETSIGDNKVISFNFNAEMSPHDLSKGLFISGLYNMDVTYRESGYLVTHLGERIVHETSGGIYSEDQYFLN